jgi:hypothetical protein
VDVQNDKYRTPKAVLPFDSNDQGFAFRIKQTLSSALGSPCPFGNLFVLSENCVGLYDETSSRPTRH